MRWSNAQQLEAALMNAAKMGGPAAIRLPATSYDASGRATGAAGPAAILEPGAAADGDETHIAEAGNVRTSGQQATNSHLLASAHHRRILSVHASLLADARGLQPCWRGLEAPVNSSSSSSPGCTAGQHQDFRLALHAAVHASIRHYVAAFGHVAYAARSTKPRADSPLVQPHPAHITPGAVRLLPGLTALLGKIAAMGEGVDCK